MFKKAHLLCITLWLSFWCKVMWYNINYMGFTVVRDCSWVSCNTPPGRTDAHTRCHSSGRSVVTQPAPRKLTSSTTIRFRRSPSFRSLSVWRTASGPLCFRILVMEHSGPVTADCLPDWLHTARRTNHRVSIERGAFLRCQGPVRAHARLCINAIGLGRRAWSHVFNTLILMKARSERMISQQGRRACVSARPVKLTQAIYCSCLAIRFGRLYIFPLNQFNIDHCNF